MFWITLSFSLYSWVDVFKDKALKCLLNVPQAQRKAEQYDFFVVWSVHLCVSSHSLMEIQK